MRGIWRKDHLLKGGLFILKYFNSSTNKVYMVHLCTYITPILMKIQKYVAELVGTFALTLAVAMSISVGFTIGTAAVASLTVGLFVYTVGGVSGAHFNPAVSIAMVSLKKLSNKDALVYIIFQVVGALLAILVVTEIGGAAPELVAENTMPVGIAEAIGTFILVFGVSSVALKKIDNDASGLVVAGSLFLGLMLAGVMSNGILNPAVAIAFGSVSWMYMLGPVVGGIVGAQVYNYLVSK